MPFLKIPSEDKKLIKADSGELFGNILTTKNIGFESNPGKIRLSERLFRVQDKDDDSDFDLPVAVIRTDASATDQFWALTQRDGTGVTDGLMWKVAGTDPSASWAQDAISNTPTDAVSNMVIFGKAGGNDRLIVARDTDLALLNQGTWTASWWQSTLSGSALTAGPHHIHVFTNLLIIPDKNKVHIVDDSLVVTEDKITLPEEYNIIWVENDGEFVYFGTEHETGGQALVFPWRPGDETYSDPMPVYDKMSLAGANKSGVIHTINSKGQILKSNGQSFEEIARLPVANSHLQWQTESLTTTPLMVHANGFKFIEDDLHIMLSGMIGGITKRVLEEMPGGIWILNEHGIRQKYSVGNYDGSTDNDWGSSIVHLPGCIFDVGLGDGRFLVGAQVYKADVTTLQPALYLSQTSSTVTQRGYFITTQLTGRALRSFWGRLTIFFKEFDNSTDRIVVKFRTTKDKNFERSNFSNTFIVGTWDASLDTTITINDPNGANLSVGDELEVLSGIGGGSSTHILTVTNTSGNLYTIVLDEGVPNVEGTGSIIFRPQNWTKLGTISDTTLFQQLYTIVKRTKWIQLKVELRGTHLSPEVEQLLQEFKDSR